MSQEDILQALSETRKKIDGLKEFHIPVVLKIIEDYQREGADELFIGQQKAQLHKLQTMVADLEAKAERLRQRL